MGRTARANLPGVPFHLTARVQGREPLFAGAECPIVDMLLDSVGAARMLLLAYAIMPNHLHVIVVQGVRPLSALMQPLLRRIAVRTARRHRLSGHLFERRYRDHACLDAAYLRSAIAYVHLNPVRARLCRSPDAFPWTSHHVYGGYGRLPTPRHMAVEMGLRLFAQDDWSSQSWLTAYHGFLHWRQALDTCGTEVGGAAAGATPLRPITGAIWHRTCLRRGRQEAGTGSRPADLEETMTTTMMHIEGGGRRRCWHATRA
jgi:putative transposase